MTWSGSGHSANSSSVAHCWANGFWKKDLEKNCGRVFFETIGDYTTDERAKGDRHKPAKRFKMAVIYSYGHHFPMGIIDIPNGVVYLNTQSYSSTTSGHQSDVRRAINDSLTPTTHYISSTRRMGEILDSIKYGDNNQDEIRRVLISDRMDRYRGAKREFKAITRITKNTEWRYTQCIETLNAVRELQGKKILKVDAMLEKFNASERMSKYRINSKKNAILEEKRKARENHKRYLSYYKDDPKRHATVRLGYWETQPQLQKQKWGTDNHVTPSVGAMIPNQYTNWKVRDLIHLKIEDGRVKTSNHNAITIRAAKAVLKMWFSIVGKSSFADKERKVENYQGLTIRKNGTVKIGCTRILPDEVISIAKQLGVNYGNATSAI